MRIAQETRHSDLLNGERFSFLLCTPGFCFLPKRFDCGYTEDVAVELTRQSVVLQNDVKRLVPRHIVEHDGQVASDIWIEYDVQPADFVNQAEEVLQTDILQIDRNRLSGVLRGGIRCLRMRLLLGSEIYRRLNCGAGT